MTLSAVEIFGYCASALIAYSLTQSSLVKLRWINLFGSSSFCAYGLIIGAYPVAILNGFIAMTNVFFLRKLLIKTEDNFGILQANRPSNYVDFFLNYHKQEIDHLFPRFLKQADKPARHYFFLTEHSEVVGLISGYEGEGYDFIVDFDFVVPAYRDCRLGQFALGEGQHLKKLTGFKRVGARADSVEHEAYLIRLGMRHQKNGIWAYE